LTVEWLNFFDPTTLTNSASAWLNGQWAVGARTECGGKPIEARRKRRECIIFLF
jgi:hypothetical protein